MSSVNCNKEMSGYHADEVNLCNDDQKEMRGRRDAGRTRLENGLARAEHPLPKKTRSQGSYAMRTMTQDDDCDYDIDDGVYFEKDDLKDSNGNYLSPRDARVRVCNALKDGRLADDAVVKTNCVRQNYPAGYHIDIPVYRIVRSKDSFGNDIEEYEHASGDEWVKSDARAVTRWYNDKVGSELKSGETDYSQLRRTTRFTKKFARSRKTWKKSTTSGICLSKLVVDEFASAPGRDDDAVRETWKKIKTRLDLSLEVQHPVRTNENLADYDDEGVGFFRDCLADALKKLEVLDEPGCTRQQARDAWDGVFNTTYFSSQPMPEEDKSTKAAIVVVSQGVADRQDGGGRFG